MAFAPSPFDISGDYLRAAIARAQEDEATKRAAIAAQASMANAQLNAASEAARINQRSREVEASRADAAAERSAVGTTTDLGDGYRGVLDARGGVHIIEPPKPSFTPDAATVESLQKAGYVWAPQSDRGGTFLPSKEGTPPKPLPGTTTDLGRGYQEVIGAGGKAHVIKPPTTKPDAMTDLKVKGLLAELADIDGQLAEHTSKIAAGDTRHGLLNMFSREETAKDLNARRAKAATELETLRGSSAAAPVQTPAPTPKPAASASPAATADGRVTVQKDGKRYRLPAAQLEEAKKQGYTPL